MFVEEYKTKIQPVLESGGDKLFTSEVPEEEQKEAEQYVLLKEMVRPATSLITVLGWFFITLICAFGITALFYLFSFFELEKISNFIKIQISQKSIKFFTCVFIISFLFVLFIFRNALAIGLIHLYQHYSPEEKRRSCLFKPTCSEYAIIAINKYGIHRALPKIIDRCKRCHGSIYRIDYP